MTRRPCNASRPEAATAKHIAPTTVLCQVFGHKFCPNVARYYFSYYCERCGYESPDDADDGLLQRARREIRFFVFRYWCRVAPLRNWLRCSECGRRFGRHDSSNDHIPF